MEIEKLNFDCEELLHWWEPQSDIRFIFNFNWSSLQQLRDAITFYLSARLDNISNKATKAISETGCIRLEMLMASNPDTPADLLDYLSRVCSDKVVVRIAENPTSSRETLGRLALHRDPEVRMAVSENSNTPEKYLSLLVNDKSNDVRYRVAENPHTPPSTLYYLLKDENPYVSNRAKETLKRLLRNASLDGAENLADTFFEEADMLVALEKTANINPALMHSKLMEQLQNLDSRVFFDLSSYQENGC